MSRSEIGPGGPRVAVIGGGLAGLAAAVAAAEVGLDVELFEARQRLGGRAGSFRDPHSGELIDHCRHVAMGCCTNLADFCRRTGLADCFRRYRRLHFIGPDATRHDLAATRLLPAPLHLVPGLMRLGYLGFRDRLRILRTMTRLARLKPDGGTPDATIGSWLREQGESDRALERFWSVVLVSALSETLDRASLAAARKVFVDGFLGSRRAYELDVPQRPLDEIFDRRLAAWLTERGVVVHRGTRVRQIAGDGVRAEAVELPDGSQRRFDFFVTAVPWRNVRAILAEPMLRALPALDHVDRIEAAPITAVHLWFDRPITGLPHAVLVGRLSQWVFPGTQPADDSAASQPGFYYQVVISASHELKGRDRDEVVGQVRDELGAIWPAARDAQLLRWQMVTHPEAVFSVTPSVERLRPAQQTPIPNLMLAGDWTATGWPATMEGAIRSGYLAVEAILRSLGRPQRLLAADLPRGPLARWILGSEVD